VSNEEGAMNNDIYRDSHDEVSSELQKILGEDEQLRLREARIEKIAELLKPTSDMLGKVETDHVMHESQLEGYSVVTHFTVVRITK
jgi:hypothetical protein